ncbi:probable C-mannosyltransferase DPY19L1 [Nilaparvata lugens]|uniref:probable C-mannosyltransferase DPY19L1 n=1 Tax=Nilaparvata lugens TaxID=108931 RepID=UPI00193CD59F|nr:probable C-mannosyltransferase DPY19L1 [Nilaparvata lugens]
MKVNRRVKNPNGSDKTTPSSSKRDNKGSKIELDDSTEQSTSNWIRFIIIIILGLVFSILNRYHVATVFENSRHFSHLSNLEREMSFRSEMGMYYSYYKRLVESPSFFEGLYDITHDNLTEYPSKINTLERFNLLPEVLISGLYRVYSSLTAHLEISTKECWQVERGSGLAPIISCVGTGDPVYFYLEVAWVCASFTTWLIFVYAFVLSDSISGAAFAVLAFFCNHGESTRVQWAPPLRETFAYPFVLTQMLLVAIILRQTKHINEENISFKNSVLIVSLSISTCVCLVLWQFSQFVLATQTLAVLIMCNLTVISKEAALIIVLGQMLGVVQSLAAMFGNELLLTSIFTCLLLSSISTLIFVSPVVEKRWNFIARGAFVMSFVTFLTLVLKTRVFTANQDSHIVNILKSKLTNFKDFHSLLYVCAPEFDFLGWEAVLNLTTTWLLPTCIIVVGFVIAHWLPLLEFKSKAHFRPLKNLEPDVVYTFLQCGMFAVMAGMVMRLKLFLTPHMCIVGALIRSQKYFKSRIGTIAHWGLFTIIVGGMCAKGYSNIMTQRNVEGEYSNIHLEELLMWIESSTERSAVFGGTMPIMASVLLSTQRPIVNHPHYEDAKLRERTKKVYSIYSRKPPEEVFKMLSLLGVEYVVLSRSWCYRESSSGCKMSDLWDVEDPINEGKPEVCKQLIANTPLPFVREFSNQEYTVLRLPTPYVELTGVKQVAI